LDHNYLKLLEQRHQQLQQQQSQRGIDFHQADRRQRWPFQQFAAKFAKLLGRKGGISGLGSQEMELLNRVHASHHQISEPLLEQAFGQAELMTIPVIVFHLQKLLYERSS
jgi:hypothetical protein